MDLAPTSSALSTALMPPVARATTITFLSISLTHKEFTP